MTIYLIVFIAIMSHLAHSGSRVAVTLYALHLGANQMTVGVLVALYALCPMLLSVFIGRFADRVPPRLPMIVGTLGIGLALILPAVFPGIPVLYVSAFIIGLFNQFFNLPLEAAVGGIGGAEHRVRNYAVLGMGWSVASFLGPLITGFSIDFIGHRSAFLVLAAFTTIPVIFMWLKPDMLPRVARHSSGKKPGSIVELIRIPPLRTTLIAGSIVISAWDLFQFYLPIYGHSVGLSASVIGTILGLVSAATFVVRGIVPFLTKRLTEAEILSYSIFISALPFVLMPFFVDAYALAAIGFLLGLGVGCANPMGMSLLYVLTPEGRVAESMGLRKTVNHSTHLVIPLIFGSVGSAFGFATVFFSNAVMLTIGGFLMSKARIPTIAQRPE